MMKVYLDTSVYNRLFDDQTQPRIWLETLAFAVILQMIEAGSRVGSLVRVGVREQSKSVSIAQGLGRPLSAFGQSSL